MFRRDARRGAPTIREKLEPSLRRLRRSREPGYLMILALFLVCMYVERFNFTARAEIVAERWQKALNTVLIAATLLYAFHVLLRMILAQPGWRGRLALMLAAAGLTALVYFAYIWRGNLEAIRLHAIVALLLVLLSYGKDFRGIVKVFLAVYSLILLVAVLGLFIGYTADMTKHSAYGVKYSFGMIHPNTTGHVIMLIALCVWYLWLRGRPAATCALFWGVVIPLGIFVRCRTAMALMALFPALPPLLRRTGAGERNRRILNDLLLLSPWLFLGLSLLMCSQAALFHRTYGTLLQNFSERFVQGFIALKTYGLPLLGCDINTSGFIVETINGVRVHLVVMDNAYVSYGIILGSLWLSAAMAWLSLAHRKALRRRDCDALSLSLLMLVFAMMERRGLDVGYNPIFLYTLAHVRPNREDGHV